MILALFAALPMVFGQNSPQEPLPSSAPPPTDKSFSLMPSPASDSRPAPVEGVPLIPPLPVLPGDATTPAPGATPSGKKGKTGPSKTDAAEDAMQLHIKLRAAKTKALEDPIFQAELAKIPSLKTDYEMREAYKRYYVLLYARMTKIDPSIAAGIAGRANVSYSREYQFRVTPTIPLDQIGLPKPIGPENAIATSAIMGTPPPRRFFGQARIGESQ